ncbi:MAG: arylsulfatase [Acidobacteriales bacterium]|nr:arylsulfatase [Terriglobales bacterium]
MRLPGPFPSKSLLLLSSLLLLGFISTHLSAQPARPNIVVLIADDLGWGDLGCYGATKVKTPNLDRLAREGMRFTDAHSPSSVCTPSRYNLLTGRYSWRTWARTGTVWANDPLLIEPGRVTVASLLRDAGYFTGCVGKWHLGFGAPSDPGFDRLLGLDWNGDLKPGPLEIGFSYFFGMPAIGQNPNVFIENHRVIGIKPDDPIEFRDDSRAEFKVEYLSRPRTEVPNIQFSSGKTAQYVFEEGALKLTEKAVAFIEQHWQKPFFLYYAARNVHSPVRPNARFKGTSEIGAYGDFIHELDWSIGEILNTLDRLKLTDNTFVIFTSDNGAVAEGHRPAEIVDYQGHRANGPYRGQKTEVYEGGHRIPFIARWPGVVKAGSRSDALIANTDLLATFADLLGSELPRSAGEDSFSFLNVLRGRIESSRRRTIVNDSMQGLFAIREGNWKLILGQGGGGLGWDKEARKNKPAGQLFDLGADPGETTNLYERYPEKVRQLTIRLDRIKQSGTSK